MRADYSIANAANLDAGCRATLVFPLSPNRLQRSLMGATEQFILFTQPG